MPRKSSSIHPVFFCIIYGVTMTMAANSGSTVPPQRKTAPRTKNIRGDSDVSGNDDDDSITDNNEKLESGLNFFDAFQEEQVSNDNSIASNNSEYLMNEAYTGALAGENVLDSPTSQRRKTKKLPDASRSQQPSLSVTNQQAKYSHSATSTSAQKKSSSSSSSASLSDPISLSLGLVNSGFAWIREQREERRRRHLHQLAEEQAKKIEAAKQPDLPQRSSLSDNPVFQNLTSVQNSSSGGGASATASSFDTAGDDHATIEETAVSYSGDGYTFKIAVPADDIAAAQDPDEVDSDWVPPVRIQEEENVSSAPFLLNESQRQCIAQQVLPKGIAYAKWKRLYSLARDGDSFEACLRLVQGHAQTLMVVRTSTNELLGGFADMTWESSAIAGAVYHGGPTSCLYSFVGTRNAITEKSGTKKKDIHVYKWTGANRYIQLCDTQHKMLAFGGGGDDGAFGLSVAQDFQHGSSGPCATFDNAPLASNGNFSIVDLEIYCFLLGQF